MCRNKKVNSKTRQRLYSDFLLDYDYIQNYYIFIEIGLSRQKEWDPDLKAILQIEFVGKLKNADGAKADST